MPATGDKVTYLANGNTLVKLVGAHRFMALVKCEFAV